MQLIPKKWDSFNTFVTIFLSNVKVCILSKLELKVVIIHKPTSNKFNFILWSIYITPYVNGHWQIETEKKKLAFFESTDFTAFLAIFQAEFWILIKHELWILHKYYIGILCFFTYSGIKTFFKKAKFMCLSNHTTDMFPCEIW